MTTDKRPDTTKEEDTMYAVMQAIFESGIPISFKGSMVLKAFLIEAGYQGEVRHTKDIDGNWNTDYPPTSEQVADSIQKALHDGGMRNFDVQLFRKHGEKRAVGIAVLDKETGEKVFKMDIDVNRTQPQTQLYEIDGIVFSGTVPMQMIADKVASISSDRIFRRVKDVIDLYYISQVVLPDREYVDKAMKDSSRELGTFESFFRRKNDIRHAYEKFNLEGNAKKPDFEEVYVRAASFLIGLYPEELKSFADVGSTLGMSMGDSFPER